MSFCYDVYCVLLFFALFIFALFCFFKTDHQKLEREARICRLLKHPNIGENIFLMFLKC